MDDHLDSVLHVSSIGERGGNGHAKQILPKFIPVVGSQKEQGRSFNHDGKNYIIGGLFQGKKEGYAFRRGESGIGYYLDNSSANNNGKRNRDNDSNDYNEKRRKNSDNGCDDSDNDHDSDLDDADGNNKQNEIEKLLKKADEVEIEPLNPITLKQLLVSIEKKVNKNQKLRIKYSDEPAKFMDSEIELNDDIQELYTLAASPELYPNLSGDNKSVSMILQLIAHENTDISVAVIGLLQELLDIESLGEDTVSSKE